MTISEAIFVRRSLRRYLPSPISTDQQAQLQKAIDQVNRRSGLHFRLDCDHPDPFASFTSTYGKLKGVRNYLIFSGPESDEHLEEKCGYFGEEIILVATAMGLGTCWVGGTFRKKKALGYLQSGDKLVCVAAIGHTAETMSRGEALMHGTLTRRSKTAEKLSFSPADAPDWFSDAMEAVRRAPSAVNRQGVFFTMDDSGTVTGRRTAKGPFSLVDLGIAKYHFEIGAHGGLWTWGDNGSFTKAKEEKSCGAVIWRMNGGVREYLLARHNGGHWSFPKGHVEQGETEVQTAQREIREETGLLSEIDTGFRHVVTYYPKHNVIKDVVFFLATITGGVEHAQEEEIADIRWFTFQETRSRITFATDEEILLAAEAYLEK